MMNRRPLPAAWILVVFFVGMPAKASEMSDRLAARIDPILEEAGHEIAVVCFDAATGETFARNERVEMHAASTMKVPVMLAIFDAVSRGELDLDQGIEVRNEFKSIMDGSPFSLNPEEDGDPTLYESIGSEVSLRELTTRMITRSSNLATNIVIELVGAPKVMDLMKSMGANDIKVLRGVEDIKAYRAGKSNTTTAWDLMLVFRGILEHDGMDVATSHEMLEILAAQEFNESIPAGVPEGTRVAHKTGSITAIAHDAGIVFPADRDPYILVLLTRGFENGEDAHRVMAEISKAVWDVVTGK